MIGVPAGPASGQGEFRGCYSAVHNRVSVTASGVWEHGFVTLDLPGLEGQRIGTYLMNEIVGATRLATRRCAAAQGRRRPSGSSHGTFTGQPVRPFQKEIDPNRQPPVSVIVNIDIFVGFLYEKSVGRTADPFR
jgi:hypothetical protein